MRTTNVALTATVALLAACSTADKSSGLEPWTIAATPSVSIGAAEGEALVAGASPFNESSIEIDDPVLRNMSLIQLPPRSAIGVGGDRRHDLAHEEQ